MRRDVLLVFLSPLLLVVMGIGVLQVARERRTGPEEVPGQSLYGEVMNLVRDNYVIGTDEEALIYGAARGMVEQLDPHSRVFDAKEWDEHTTRNEGRYFGIGIVVGHLRKRLSILEVTPGGPAEAALLQAGDHIVSIDGRRVPEGQVTDEIVSSLRGPPDTTLVLGVVPFGEEGPIREVNLTREFVVQRSVYGGLIDLDHRIGYLCLSHFRENTGPLLDEVVDGLHRVQMRSLVLDLRGNRGGYLEVAVRVADRFIDSGVIVSTVGRREQRSHHARALTPEISLPLVVLVDGRTASAGEVLAGALQDHNRAVLVGERTYGKGVVQAISAFATRPGGLKLTTAHYFTPGGRCIEKHIALPNGETRRGGLFPDVFLPVSEAARQQSDRLRERIPYANFIRRILAEEDDIPDSFEDPQLSLALDLLRGLAPKARPLLAAH